MRTAFIETLCEIAQRRRDVWLLTGDLGYSVLEPFREQFPDRYVNVGVAEQNMIGVAAGLASTGKTVFTYSIANFAVLRCLEQIRNDVGYHQLPVKLVSVGGGFAYGSQGYTHHGIEDLGILRSLPDMTVVAPGDPVETRLAVEALVAHRGPCFLRLGKAGEPLVHQSTPAFALGRAIVVRPGYDLTFITTGGMLRHALDVAQQLARQHHIDVRVLSMPTLKPLDEAAILRAARETRGMITVEEHSIATGLGSAVAAVMAEHVAATPLRQFGVPDAISHQSGSQSFLRQSCGDLPALALACLRDVDPQRGLSACRLSAGQHGFSHNRLGQWKASDETAGKPQGRENGNGHVTHHEHAPTNGEPPVARADRPCISIVTPCYNEESNVEPCREAVAAIFAEHLPEYDFEHIFCDNASGDGTVTVLRRMAKDDPRVKVILNSRNFGPFRSTFNALQSTIGDAVVVMLAADLQDPPQTIVEFVRQWEQGHQVVYGIRANREENFAMRWARRIYYRLVCRTADIEIPPDVGEFQLVDRSIIDVLRRCDDYYPYIRGLIANCGHQAVGVPYTWKARRRGISKNRLYHLIDQGLNGLISFTNLPMRLCALTGLTLSALSFAYSLFTVVVHLLYHGRLAAPGVPTLIAALFFFSGVQLLFLGVLGEYISAIHFQVRKRPLVIERERINFSDETGQPSAALQANGARRQRDREETVGNTT